MYSVKSKTNLSFDDISILRILLEAKRHYDEECPIELREPFTFANDELVQEVFCGDKRETRPMPWLLFGHKIRTFLAATLRNDETGQEVPLLSGVIVDIPMFKRSVFYFDEEQKTKVVKGRDKNGRFYTVIFSDDDEEDIE